MKTTILNPGPGLHPNILGLIIFCLLIPQINQAQAPISSIAVSFQVDLSEVKPTTPVGIRGNTAPLSWDRTYPLEDKDGDGIYEGTIEFQAQQEVLEYKMVYGKDPVIWELEMGPNRLLVLKGEKMQSVSVKWDVPDPIDVDALPKISSTALLEDFEITKKALRTLHPGLYRYNTKQQIDSLFTQFEQKMGQPMSYREVYLAYSELLAKLKCGHTYANFFNQSGFIQEVVFGQPDKIPFLFRIAEGKMIITQNLSNNEKLNGFPEVVSINGVQTQAILQKLMTLIKADGSNDAKRLADLNLLGFGPFESFDVYFPLLYPPVDGQFVLEIKGANAKQNQSVTVSAVTRQERTTRMLAQQNDYPSEAEDLWKLEFWADGTAYLQLGTFSVFNFSFEWKDFLDDAFNQMKKQKTQNLVLDIRWNEGGQDEILVYLAKMLAKNPVKRVSRKDYMTYQKVPDELRPYLSSWTDEVYDVSDHIEKEEYGMFLLKEEEATKINPPAKGFSGQTYLLVNAANSSATFYFAELAQINGWATVVGQTTGGNQKGLNGGIMFFVRLPNSQIEFDIPLIGSFSPEKPDAGIQPDIEVEETIQSLREGTDPVLEVIRKKIRN